MMIWKLKVIHLYQTLETADEWIADALKMHEGDRRKEAVASLEEAVQLNDYAEKLIRSMLG